jgi:hypothetical protein
VVYLITAREPRLVAEGGWRFLDGDKLHVDPGGLREDPEVFRV